MNQRGSLRGEDADLPKNLLEETTGHLVPEAHGTTCGGPCFFSFCDGCTSLYRERVEMRPQDPLGTGRVQVRFQGVSNTCEHWSLYWFGIRTTQNI